MWTRAFLIAGLASGGAIAAIALGGLWLATAFISDDFSSTGVRFAGTTAHGILVYPACWFAVVFRKKDYSISRTLILVVITFIVVWCVLIALVFALGLYVAAATIAESQDVLKALAIVAITPFATAFMTLIGAILLVVPYAVIATPAAFLHRWLLMRFFTAPTSTGIQPV